MKTVRLRVMVTAEDAATVVQVQARLRGMLDSLGTEYLEEDSVDELGKVNPGPRVFWQTSDVRQGSDGAEGGAAKRRTKPQ